MAVLRILLVSLLITAWVVAATAQPDPVRIMPLGDSITESSGGHASYRYWLWHELLDAGYHVDFVGSMYGVYNGQPLYSDFDQIHEGHWGWRVDEILAQILGWASTYDPEIILIHLGTNDIWQGQGVASTITELGDLIAEIRLVNPTAKFLLAQLIPSSWGGHLDLIPDLNAQIPPLASSLTSPQSPIYVVDQYTGFDPNQDTWDGVHPDESGEQKMSDRWLAQLDAILSTTGVRTNEPPLAWLAPGYPNPFNPRTTIRFTLRADCWVRLGICDIRGNLLETVATGILGQGDHIYHWMAPATLASGPYLARLESAEGVLTRKLMLVK